MQLSVSTPSSDTNLAALLLGGETVSAAPATPGTVLPPAAFEQLITGLTPAAAPSPAPAAAAPVVTEAPVALLVAPALRNFTPNHARAAAAPVPSEAELPLPVPGEVTVPTVPTAKAAPRPAPRAPSRGSSAKSESPAAHAPTITPAPLPPIVPLAPQPLPTDLLTLAPAAVAAEENSPADPTLTPSGEAVVPSTPQVAAPVVGRTNVLTRAPAPLASRPAATSAAVTPFTSSAPLAPAVVATEENSPADQILTPSGEFIAPSFPQVAAPVVGRTNVPARDAAPLTPRRGSPAVAGPPLASSAPLASAPLAAPEASATAPEVLSAPGTTLTPRSVGTPSLQAFASAPLFSITAEAGVPPSDPAVAPAHSATPDLPTVAPIHTFAPADLVSRQFTPSPRATAPAAPETIAASFADSRSTDRLTPAAQPILPSDVALLAPTTPTGSAQPVFSAALPAADGAANSTMPPASAAAAVPAASRPMSPEPAPDFSTFAPAAPVALADTATIASSPAAAASAAASAPSSIKALAAAFTTSDTPPAAHASNLPIAPKAKIAARSEIRGTTQNSAFSASDKNFLNAETEVVVNTPERVGTDVAKSGPVMSTATFTEQPASAAVPAHASFAPVARVTETDFSALEATSAPGESASVADAHRAVEAVLVAADRTANGDRHTVNLHFTVAGNELAVRVEMRADEVRATFHAASPELRDALAREWQAVRADPSTDSSLRLAPAVFTTGQGNTNGGSSSLGGDASSRQRDPGAQRGEDQTFFTAAPRSLRPTDPAPASSVLTPATPTNSRGGAHRLHAHA